jgi:hypothetical protein
MSEEPEASRASRLRRLTQCPSRKRKTQARNRRRSTLSSSAKFESKPLTSGPISGSPNRATRERQRARREAGEYLNVTGVRLMVPLSIRSRSVRDVTCDRLAGRLQLEAFSGESFQGRPARSNSCWRRGRRRCVSRSSAMSSSTPAASADPVASLRIFAN